ncbi:MAG: aminotransferase class IV [Cyclobacteriaceae bacterium]|nr:aminotransferase class IV [Cyclobacteriaceae bacterium]
MKAIFNHSTIRIEDLKYESLYRATFYADGFFETMCAENGCIPLWSYHVKRLFQAGKAAGLQGLNEIIESIPVYVESLSSELSGKPVMRCKLTIWREGMGLYSPESDQTNFLLSASILENPTIREINHVGFCEKVFNTWHFLSKFKQIGAQSYVIAAREMKSRSLDDIIILDAQGNISEALYSNIFWSKDDQLFTPALETGCVEGTMRNYLIDKLPVQTNEVCCPREELLHADAIFFSNALGICHLNKLEGSTFIKAQWVEDFLPFII